MEEDCSEDESSNKKIVLHPCRYRQSIEERMDTQTQDCRKTRSTRYHCLGVCFFSKMEMSDDGMLEKMEDTESDDDVERRRTTKEFDALGDQLEKNKRKKKSGAECDEILLNTLGPFFSKNDKCPAENFGSGCNQTEDDDTSHLSSVKIYRTVFLCTARLACAILDSP